MRFLWLMAPLKLTGQIKESIITNRIKKIEMSGCLTNIKILKIKQFATAV